MRLRSLVIPSMSRTGMASRAGIVTATRTTPLSMSTSLEPAMSSTLSAVVLVVTLQSVDT
jgi:hypothetical protein